MRGHKKRHSHSGSHGFHVEVLREVDEISSPILKGVYRPQSHYLNSFLLPTFFSFPLHLWWSNLLLKLIKLREIFASMQYTKY